MRTTKKRYDFALTLDRHVPGITNSLNLFRFHGFFQSIRSAESYARKHAEILSKLASPVSCTIEYRTTKGKQTRTLDLREEVTGA